MLAGAAILILLTEGTEVPSDISWEAFHEMCSIDDISWEMNSLIPSNIPRVYTLIFINTSKIKCIFNFNKNQFKKKMF